MPHPKAEPERPGRSRNILVQSPLSTFEGRSTLPSAPDEIGPKNPSLHAMAAELLGYLHSLEHHMDATRDILFGSGEANNPAADKDPQSIEGMLAMACQRAASLSGDLGTINNALRS